jgi:AbrB family looped-hinge helix DNA binding protein
MFAMDELMSTATINFNGQVTVPVGVRKDLKIDAGDRVEFVQIAPGRYELVAATREVTALKEMLGPAKKAVSIESMNAAIAPLGSRAR